MLRRLRGAHAASSLNGEDKNKLESNYRRRLPSNTAGYLYGRGVERVLSSLLLVLLVLLLRNLLVITWQRSHSSQLAMECNITAALLRLDIAGSKMREAQAKRELDSAQSASEQELDAVERVEWIRRLQILEEERNATRSGFQATLVSNFDLGALRA
mmetsp:Transcript_10655/g.24333  ORF Transcript_10655/g.24333 Transcript_10655/m.24333 type:complete len:157 (-) Transcript_10655:62-532(-)